MLLQQKMNVSSFLQYNSVFPFPQKHAIGSLEQFSVYHTGFFSMHITPSADTNQD